jgi:tRNA (guanine-N7-)-methyltransferase
MYQRKIRSYILRAGRMSKGQKEARLKLAHKYLIDFRGDEPVSFASIFGNKNPIVLEIGFGMGDTTFEIAKNNTDTNYIGIEVHPPGVGRLLKLCESESLTNVRVIERDATEVIPKMFDDGSLAGIHIFFPDPWPKKRHHKRRLINKGFVDMIATTLQEEGYLHVATDWEDYATETLKILEQNSVLQNTSHAFTARPDYRPTTKFERRGINLGHNVFDIVFRKISSI